MGSRWTLVGAALALALGGCTGDLFVPEGERAVVEESAAPADSLAEFEPWAPAFRVIGVDGVERPDFLISVSNDVYYPGDGPEGAPRDRFAFRSDGGEFRPIHPPLDLELTFVPDSVATWSDFAVIPAPGDTVEVDLRRTTHVIPLDFDVPPEWGQPSMSARLTAEWEPPAGTETIRRIRSVRISRVVGDSLRLWLSDRVTTIDLVDFRFDDLGPDLSGFLRWAVSPEAPPDAVASTEIEFRPRVFHVRLLQDGAPIAATPVEAEIESLDPDHGFRRAARFDGIVGAEPWELVTPDADVELRVQCEQVGEWFLPWTADLTIAHGDTVTAELGRHEVALEVVEPDGSPAVGAWSRMASVFVFRQASSITGLDGRVRFVSEPGIRSLQVGWARGQVAADTTITVDEDVVVRMELPR